MENMSAIITLTLKAVPLAMSVAVVVLGILGATDADTNFTLLGIGLFCLSLAALQDVKVE